jgi:hypothetical protein
MAHFFQKSNLKIKAAPLPHKHRRPLDFFLQLQDAVQQGLRRGGASGDVNVYGHDAVASAHHGIGIMVIPAAIGAGSHGNDPAGLWHLIVNLAQGWGHFVG